ncbi:molybdenum cofactor guanylyltransferase [Melghirimyces algeriensis]|uniref:Probable molybdenum cofactor guanylyltransferase n=1 Tax=Melghirimyces algeriensis TaxID=910412 RepID=A0A521AM86_9BACL|nr:molybdenum cofactor guanylyltransferase [Melghirimyces algeriensis]SMO35913.1 molybdopterin-guanine dinucleotide biosynthesis protein A [Melghirimyces algeriensis]
MNPYTGVIILTGGQSRRMGRNKATLSIAGEPMIQRLLRRLCNDPEWVPIISVKHPAQFHDSAISIAVDQYPGKGPLSGIHAGLTQSPYLLNLVTACDLPYASRCVAQHLRKVAIKGDFDAVVPVSDGRIHPLFAVYHRRCLDPLERFLKAGKGRVQDFLQEIQTRYTTGPFPTRAFFNMNRPEDYLQVNEWEKGQS